MSTPASNDWWAKSGLRCNTFHTTALCSPTRSALITGRNHHTDATGVITEMGTGYPGYNSLMSTSCGTVGEILKQNGYNTSWYGKNHNVPHWQSSQAGPFNLWPTGLGFEYFYGFIGGDTDQWHPAIFDGTHPIEAPHDAKNYHLDADLADHAISWIRQQHALAPDKPFFAYYAPGLCHAPHHVPKEWIAKFKGQFDQGWDKVREESLARQIQQDVVPAGTKLTARPKEIPAWDSLNADQKKLYAHMMEIYAACLSYCDSNIGRVINAIEETGELDNTLINYIQRLGRCGLPAGLKPPRAACRDTFVATMARSSLPRRSVVTASRRAWRCSTSSRAAPGRMVTLSPLTASCEMSSWSGRSLTRCWRPKS